MSPKRQKLIAKKVKNANRLNRREVKFLVGILEDIASGMFYPMGRGKSASVIAMMMLCKLRGVKSPIKYQRYLIDKKIHSISYPSSMLTYCDPNKPSCIRDAQDIVALAGSDRKTMEKALGLKIHTYEAKKGVIAALKWMVGK